jgi:hypothetical protein
MMQVDCSTAVSVQCRWIGPSLTAPREHMLRRPGLVSCGLVQARLGCAPEVMFESRKCSSASSCLTFARISLA